LQLLLTQPRSFSPNIKTFSPRISLLSPSPQIPKLSSQSLVRNRRHYATHAPFQEDVTHQDYPHAPPGVFTNPADMNQWKKLLQSSRSPIWRVTKTGDSYSCFFEVHVTDDRKYETEKVAQSRKDAISAASRDMLIKLHNNGVLRECFIDIHPAGGEGDVPTQDDYPRAPPRFFQEPEEILGWNWLFPLKGHSRRVKKAGEAYTCSFRVNVFEETKYETTGRALSHDDSLVAASRDMLAKLHSNGVLEEPLHKLANIDPLQWPVDRTEIARWHEEYPGAPAELFQRPEIFDYWQWYIIPRRINHVPSGTTKCIDYGRWSCNFKIWLSKDISYETEKFSTTKENAILVAAQDILGRLHHDGALKKIFKSAQPTQDPPNDQAQQPIGDEVPKEPEEGPSEATTEVKNDAAMAQKDAKKKVKKKRSEEERRARKAKRRTPINTSQPVIADDDPLGRLVKGSRPELDDLGCHLLLGGRQPARAKAKSKLDVTRRRAKSKMDIYIDHMMKSPATTTPEDHAPPFETSSASQKTDSALDISDNYADAAALPPLFQDNPKEDADNSNARAMLDVYNYCANILATPHFEILESTSRNFTILIRLPERDIQVEASGSFVQAGLHASLQFKAAVERYHREHDESSISMTSDDSLNVDNAKPFVLFYNTRYPYARITFDTFLLEHAPGMPDPSFRIQAKLKGENFGDQTMTTTLANARLIAYVVAAVNLAKKVPGIFHQFLQMEKSSQGHVLGTAKAIHLSVGPDILSAMSSASNQVLQKMMVKDEPIADEQESIMRSFRSRPVLSRSSAKRRNWALRDSYEAFQKDDSQAALRYLKNTFPMNRCRDKVLDLVNQNVYSIVIGATGSGKTTQVPQIILEDAILRGSGSEVNIICTQPRRIAATSVARRVAVERNEKLQSTVGYHIRHDSKLPNDGGSITYCTTGILLKLLQHHPDEVMDRLSHIIVDEVHERDCIIDFLMIVIKKAVESRQQRGKRVPRIVLMSATLNIELFANYFGQIGEGGATLPCPSITVPGRNFGVEEFYLEDILPELGGAYLSPELQLLRNDRATKKYLNSEKSFMANSQSTLIDWTRLPDTEKEASLVPVGLVTTTIAHIAKKSSSGAILAFLPGLGEILDVEKLLKTTLPLGVDFKNPAKFKIYFLHSSIEGGQDDVFEPVPDGCRKIILSTNVAETSVTIPDVQFVVDSGKYREKGFDQVTGITKLQSIWISKTNLKQRSGRAGRVQKGNYFALFSRARRDTFRTAGLPEILRSDLQDICLDVKAQSLQNPIKDFLAAAIEPPLSKYVEASVQKLKDLEAITEDEKLTPLGRLLASLPVHPDLGKLIVLGIIFRCFDSLLIIGAAAGEHPLLLRPLEQKAEADKAWGAFGQGTKSDPIALVNAFREARRLDRENGPDLGDDMRRSFLSPRTFKAIDRKMNEIESALAEAGLIPPCPPGDRQEFQCGHPSLNQNSDSLPLLKALIFAGYRGNLAVRSNPTMCRTRKEMAIIHPSSLNFLFKMPPEQRKMVLRKSSSSIYSYGRLDRSISSRMIFLRESTEGSALMAAIFGSQAQAGGRRQLLIDGWLPLNLVSNYIDDLNDPPLKVILKFRRALDLMLSNAFSSLAKRGDKVKYLADDPLRQKFASALTMVLEENEDTSNERLREVDSMVEADYLEELQAVRNTDATSTPSQ
jgi:ATP-dependent RNA helicase DHX36